jgi:hypothetical protein
VEKWLIGCRAEPDREQRLKAVTQIEIHQWEAGIPDQERPS